MKFWTLEFARICEKLQNKNKNEGLIEITNEGEKQT